MAAAPTSWSAEPTLPFYRIERLASDRRFAMLGVAALVAGALPVGLGSRGGLWLWQLIPTSSPAELLRFCAPLILGFGLLVIARWPRGTRLAQGLAALGLLAASVGLFSESRLAYSELFAGFMAFVGRQPLVIVLGFTLLATGAELRVEPELRRLSSWLLGLGAALLVLLYALPQRGSAFAVELVVPASTLIVQGKGREIIALVLWWGCAFVPLGLALWGALAVGRPGVPGMLGSAARYGLVGLALLMSYQVLLRGFGISAMALHVRAALLLGVTVGVASRALEGILGHLFANPLPPGAERSELARDVALRDRLRGLVERLPEGDTRPHPWSEARPGSWQHPWLTRLMTHRVIGLGSELFTEVGADGRLLTRDAASELLARLGAGDTRPEPRPASLRILRQPWLLEALGLLILCSVAFPFAWSSWRPAPDLHWELRTPSPSESEFFTKVLPQYLWAIGHRNAARLVGTSGMESVVEAREARRDLRARAREIDGHLAGRLEQLEAVIETADLAGERWVDATLPVNDRIRQLGLPYYLDPQVYDLPADKERVRIFFLVTYQVEAVQRFEWQGRELAALQLRRADALGALGEWLGYVRWQEPFAKVLVEEIAAHVSRQVGSLAATGRCGLTDLSLILPPELLAILQGAEGAGYAARHEEAIDRLCGRVLLDGLSRLGADPGATPDRARELLTRLHVDATTRHELQHQVDGPEPVVAPGVLRLAPLADDRILARIAGEASAYLTEIATGDEVMAAWVLGQLSGFVMHDHTDFRYRFAAAAALTEIAREPVVDRRGDTDIEAVKRLWEAFAAEPAESRASWLRTRAEAARQALMGDAPARPESIDSIPGRP